MSGPKSRGQRKFSRRILYVSPILSWSRKQGIKCEAGEEGPPRQMPRSERALKWTGQIYPAGSRWALPTQKSEGFILRMSGVSEGSTSRTEETRSAGQKVNPGNRVQAGPRRGKRESRETSQEAGVADQEEANDDLKSETRIGNEKDEGT